MSILVKYKYKTNKMRTIRLLIKIDEKNNKIHVVEEQALGLSQGIDKEVYLQGIYSYLLFKHSKDFRLKKVFRIEK